MPIICVTQLQRGTTRLYAMHVSEVASVADGLELARLLETSGLFIQAADQPAWRNVARRPLRVGRRGTR